MMVGAADALQPGCDGQRRRDLDDEIHGAHVNAEFEAARGDDAAQFAAFEPFLDLLAPVLRHGTVMRHRDHVGRAMRADELRGAADDRAVVRGEALASLRRARVRRLGRGHCRDRG